MSALTKYLPEGWQEFDYVPVSWIGAGALAVGAAMWMMQQHTYPDMSTVDINQQSIVYDEEQGIRCSPLIKDGKLMEFLYEDARTQHEAFLKGLKSSNNGNCLGYRPGPGQPYKWLSYQEVLDRAQNFGSGLIKKGARANPDQRIGIYSQNRVEWTLAEKACNGYSMVVVPLYDTLGPQAIKWIVEQCELEYVIVDKCEKALKILNCSDIFVKTIILVEEASDSVREKATEQNTDLLLFSEIEELGKSFRKDFVPPKAEDLHTICYTSGTTGNPKGVMQTHASLISNASAIYCAGSKGAVDIRADDIHYSYLPLAHSFEKIVQTLCFMQGASIGFYQGDIKLLTDDLQTLRPTLFPIVPRLMNKFYDKINAGARQSKIKKFMLDLALKKKLALLSKGVVTRTTIWDKLVFKKVQDMVGGRVRICVTGAAPISPTVLSFMRCALGIPLTEGYGQTECGAGLSVTLPGDYSGGNVGSPLPCCFVKLVDVPEKNYFAKENQGEVCLKGPSLFKGYFMDEEKTRAALDKDGWLHTGDVGQWLPRLVRVPTIFSMMIGSRPIIIGSAISHLERSTGVGHDKRHLCIQNGSLKIFDRSKHIFKLSQGEYIAPEKIEQIYVQSSPVAQVFVHGDSLKSSLVAVVVPDVETVIPWCRARGVNASFEEICGNETAAQLILQDMNAIGKKNGLFAFELAKKAHLSSELFSVENDLLTPTFKSRRLQLYARYKDIIVQMYKGLE